MGQSTQLYSAGKLNSTGIPQKIAINTQAGNAAPLPALQTITGTAETQILDPSQALAFPLAVAIPPGGPCEQEFFVVAVSGYIKTGQTSTVVLKLYAGSSATIGSNTQLGASTSTSPATTTVPFSIEAKCIYDSVSGKLDVQSFSAVINGTVNSTIAGSPPFSLSLSNSNNPVVSFTLTVTFGTGSAGTPNFINVKNFAINH